MDDNRPERAREIYRMLCAELDARGWSYGKDKTLLHIRCEASGAGKVTRFFIRVDGGRERVVLRALLPLLDAEESRAEMAVAVSTVNNSDLSGGRFDYDIGTGELYYHLVSSYADQKPGAKTFRYLLDLACRTLSFFSDRFLDLTLGADTLESFVEDCPLGFGGLFNCTAGVDPELRDRREEKIRAALCGALTRRDLPFRSREETGGLYLTAEGKGLPRITRFSINMLSETVSLYCAFPIYMPEELRIEGAVAACAATADLPDGRFGCDVRHGRINYRLTASCFGSEFGDGFADYLLDRAVTAANTYAEGFRRLGAGEISLTDFLDSIV